MIIREAKEMDLKEIAVLFKEVYSELPYNENWTDKNALKKINDYHKFDKILIASEDNKIIAFIIYHEIIWDNHSNIFIDEIGVDKDYRGEGIAKNLLKNVEEYAKSNGFSKIELVSNMKSNAFQLYKKIGYEETNCKLMEKIIQ